MGSKEIIPTYFILIVLAFFIRESNPMNHSNLVPREKCSCSANAVSQGDEINEKNKNKREALAPEDMDSYLYIQKIMAQEMIPTLFGKYPTSELSFRIQKQSINASICGMNRIWKIVMKFESEESDGPNASTFEEMLDDIFEMHPNMSKIQYVFDFTPEKSDRDVMDVFLCFNRTVEPIVNGGDFNGTDLSGHNSTGKDFNGKDFTGKDSNGQNSKGKDTNGKDSNGQNSKGKDSNGQDSNGKDSNGQNSKGKDSNGQDSNGKDSNGQNSKGKDSNGQDSNGKDFNGQNSNGKDSNGQNSNGQDSKGKDSNGKDSNGQDSKGKDSNGKDSNGQESNGKNSNGQDSNGKAFNGEDFIRGILNSEIFPYADGFKPEHKPDTQISQKEEKVTDECKSDIFEVNVADLGGGTCFSTMRTELLLLNLVEKYPQLRGSCLPLDGGFGYNNTLKICMKVAGRPKTCTMPKTTEMECCGWKDEATAVIPPGGWPPLQNGSTPVIKGGAPPAGITHKPYPKELREKMMKEIHQMRATMQNKTITDRKM